MCINQRIIQILKRNSNNGVILLEFGIFYTVPNDQIC